MIYGKKIENNKGYLNGILNLLLYTYKRNNWVLDLNRLYKAFDEIKIDRPIFLLGVQGGGLTLVSRMLRRNRKLISVTGNYNYWTGADELQNVLEPILPLQLTGVKYKAYPDPIIGHPRGWSYASNRLINVYRETKNDAHPRLKKRFIRIIKWLLYKHSLDKNNTRFTDKSQVFTVKVSLINALLKEYNPYFLLITRDPYASCYRATKGIQPDVKKLTDKFGLNSGLRIASQHWTNSMKFALKDSKEVKNFMVSRFEDILKYPIKELQRICDFLSIEFSEDMLPKPHHKIPFGSRFRNKWYPLRPDVNSKYFKEMKKQHIDIIERICGKYGELLNYSRPDL
jgi:hypothetical protein